jgi:hypothetical protein
MPVPADAAIQVVLSVGFFNGRIACVAGIVSLSCEEVRLTLGGGLRYHGAWLHIPIVLTLRILTVRHVG